MPPVVLSPMRRAWANAGHGAESHGTSASQRGARPVKALAVSSADKFDNLGEAMSMMGEFRQFAMRGNVVDLAVGVIIGGAFGRIVDSLVQDVIMPPIGKLFGGLDFANYYIPLNNQGTGLALAEAKKAGAVLAYGNFLTILLNFIILAFIIFQMVRLMNRLRQRVVPDEAAKAPATPEDVLLLREIRDSLRRTPEK
jgi:large conductance mechanosensitive channel